MKLVIDIPEEAYKLRVCNPVWYDSNMDKAIRNGTPLIKEFENIKSEFKTNRDEWIKGQDAEWHTYDRCICIIDEHISELKGQ